MKRNISPAFWRKPQWMVLLGVGRADFIVAAWHGFYDNKEIHLLLDGSSRFVSSLQKGGSFTINLLTEDILPCLGDEIGKSDMDMAKTSFHVKPSSHVAAPLIEEAPLCFECEVDMVSPVGKQVHIQGTVRNILADDSILVNGQIAPALLQGLCRSDIEPMTFPALPWWKRWIWKMRVELGCFTKQRKTIT